MSSNLKKNILLIGASQMAIDYANVLIAMNANFDIVSRGKEKAEKFKSEIGVNAITGGLENNLEKIIPNNYDYVINTVGQEQLFDTSSLLINKGFTNLLIEKPGGVNSSEIRSLLDISNSFNANVYIAYNRRFYASVIEAKKIIEDDGGVSSYSFDFTELSHEMKQSDKPSIVKENWFLCNSSHVVDLAFYLGGKPEEITSYKGGSLDWHKIASRFSGAGKCVSGALFSYHSNWASPGRWGIEINTSKHKLIFRPLEKLQVQEIGSFSYKYIDIDNEYDTRYKPGLYIQTNNFLNGDNSNLCSISEHVSNLQYYEKIIFGK